MRSMRGVFTATVRRGRNAAETAPPDDGTTTSKAACRPPWRGCRTTGEDTPGGALGPLPGMPRRTGAQGIPGPRACAPQWFRSGAESGFPE
ncbi:hypothetical protein AB0J81_40380, partial [Streptomyces bobili]|uniref:hypothetical protein n=1 Tax=Streptomyces bobili TaxID=67280 RepID=UPI003425B5DE